MKIWYYTPINSIDWIQLIVNLSDWFNEDTCPGYGHVTGYKKFTNNFIKFRFYNFPARLIKETIEPIWPNSIVPCISSNTIWISSIDGFYLKHLLSSSDMLLYLLSLTGLSAIQLQLEIGSYSIFHIFLLFQHYTISIFYLMYIEPLSFFGQTDGRI